MLGEKSDSFALLANTNKLVIPKVRPKLDQILDHLHKPLELLIVWIPEHFLNVFHQEP